MVFSFIHLHFSIHFALLILTFISIFIAATLSSRDWIRRAVPVLGLAVLSTRRKVDPSSLSIIVPWTIALQRSWKSSLSKWREGLNCFATGLCMWLSGGVVISFFTTWPLQPSSVPVWIPVIRPPIYGTFSCSCLFSHLSYSPRFIPSVRSSPATSPNHSAN